MSLSEDYTLPHKKPLPLLKDVCNLDEDEFEIIKSDKKETTQAPDKTQVSDEFVDAMLSVAQMKLTENDALTFATTASARLDFFFDIMQGSTKDLIYDRLNASWKEHPEDTLRLIFQQRDIRDGKGTRDEFYHCITWLRQYHPKTLAANLEHIPLVGYWKDLPNILQILAHGQLSVNEQRQQRSKRRSQKRENRREEVEKRIEAMLSDPENKLSREELIEKYRHERVEAHKEEMQKRSEEARQLRKQQANERYQIARKVFTEDEIYHELHIQTALLFAKALKNDLKKLKSDQSVSLASKWAPTPNGSHDRYTLLATTIAELLYPEAEYRKSDEMYTDYVTRIRRLYRKEYLTPLRAKIPVIETFMSKHEWEKIPYQLVTSVCMKNNKEHFIKHDEGRFNEYLNNVKSGKEKIHSGALMPHELVGEILKHLNHTSRNTSDDNSTLSIQTVEAQWNDYVEQLRKSGTLESCTAVCDVSGSMSGTPMLAAIALSLLISELTVPPFNQMLITFSEKPQVHIVKGDTLVEKVDNVRNMNWGYNTNFISVFDLILQRAQAVNLAPEKMVKRLFVFTDMEFDEANSDHGKYETTYETIKSRFEKAGYTLPEMIFWNLRGDARTTGTGASKPVQKDAPGVAMVSGFSGQLLKMFLDGRLQQITPYSTMRAAIDLPKYDRLVVVD
jgi:hypothetical protein